MCRGDAFGRTAEPGAAPHSHLGEHQRRPFLRDEVDFTVATAPIALDHAQPVAAQELGAQVLGSHACPVHGSLNGISDPAVDRDPMSAGTLYVVATPIGNLSDASPRSLETLGRCDLIACEDTRVTRTLLARHGIATPTVALHAHNERAAAGKLIEALRDGR